MQSEPVLRFGAEILGLNGGYDGTGGRGRRTYYSGIPRKAQSEMSARVEKGSSMSRWIVEDSVIQIWFRAVPGIPEAHFVASTSAGVAGDDIEGPVHIVRPVEARLPKLQLRFSRKRSIRDRRDVHAFYANKSAVGRRGIS